MSMTWKCGGKEEHGTEKKGCGAKYTNVEYMNDLPKVVLATVERKDKPPKHHVTPRCNKCRGVNFVGTMSMEVSP